jgi:hypothetical protein
MQDSLFWMQQKYLFYTLIEEKHVQWSLCLISYTFFNSKCCNGLQNSIISLNIKLVSQLSIFIVCINIDIHKDLNNYV